jgi:hypothetical protein
MSDNDEKSFEGARDAADRGELGDWVARFLSSPGSDNAPLGQHLNEQTAWWVGPVRLPIDRLHRMAGPPGAPVQHAIDREDWGDDVDDLERRIERGWVPPPVVVIYRSGLLLLEDGNHRVEGLRRTGAQEAWAVVGFDSAEDRDRFEVPVAASSVGGTGES